MRAIKAQFCLYEYVLRIRNSKQKNDFQFNRYHEKINNNLLPY